MVEVSEHAEHPWPWCYEGYCLTCGDGARYHHFSRPAPGNDYWKCEECGNVRTFVLQAQAADILTEQIAERVQPRLL